MLGLLCQVLLVSNVSPTAGLGRSDVGLRDVRASLHDFQHLTILQVEGLTMLVLVWIESSCLARAADGSERLDLLRLAKVRLIVKQTILIIMFLFWIV